VENLRSKAAPFGATTLYAGALVALMLIQALMGANLLVLFCLVAASALSFLGATKVRKTGAEMLLWAIAAYLGFAALAQKTIFGQVVQSNLSVPTMASFGLLAATFSIGIGYKLSELLCRGRQDALRLGEFFSEMAAVRAIAIPLAVVSSCLYVAHLMLVRSTADGSGEGFGGFGSFYFLQNVSLAFLWAALAWSSKSRYLLAIGGMAVFALIAAMLSNEKRVMIDFTAVTALSFIFIQRLRRFWPLFVLISIGGLLVVTFLVPALQATRLEAKSAEPLERMDLAWSKLIQTGFDTAKLNELSDQQAESYQYAYGPNLSYYFPVATNADRFSLIFPLDQVQRNEGMPTVPFLTIFSDLSQMLPGFLVDKTSEVQGDVVAWHYGLRKYGSVARPVLGAPATAYALGGYLGLLILPGMVFFLIFSCATIIGGQLRDSPIAIAISTILMICVENTVSGLLAYISRPIPIMIITILLIRWLVYRMPSYQRWLAARSARSSNFVSPSKIDAQTNVSTASR
jgi:hypothetical protein